MKDTVKFMSSKTLHFFFSRCSNGLSVHRIQTDASNCVSSATLNTQEVGWHSFHQLSLPQLQFSFELINGNKLLY